ncbi:hypothetical protein LCGC14_2325160 [marine sediment metagenome]|uniref:Uncharacterized protein n=1 Tax=marine sediment metagenome TaxID=412755 RepID=A0A0F9CH79_9ZZZZ
MKCVGVPAKLRVRAMSKIRECEHGLPYGICMKDECVQVFMGGRMASFEAERESYGGDADMDTILAHECQHGSDMRVCEKCALMDQVIRTQPVAHVTMAEWLEFNAEPPDAGRDK